MPDVKWIKITTDIFDDEKILLIETLPDANAIIVAWFKLLCLARKMNNSGVFMLNDKIPYTVKMLSTIFRMKESTVTLALDTFQQFGMIEIIDGVITIPKWGKHQSLDQLEKKRDYQRIYMQKYRKKQRLLAGDSNQSNCKTNSNANVSRADIEEDKNRVENTYAHSDEVRKGDASPKSKKEEPPLFASFWEVYPKKKDKPKAMNAWKRLKVDESLLQTILSAVERDKQSNSWQKESGQYIPYPASWLNGHRWQDEEPATEDDIPPEWREN